MAKQKIVAAKVADSDRSGFMFEHFGNMCMAVENGVYTTLDKICEEYNGGYWDFIELSNGGGYMRLDANKPEGVQIKCSNYYEGWMSMEAASIVACLYAINKAVWTRPDSKELTDQYYFLRDFALEHEEWNKIAGAID